MTVIGVIGGRNGSNRVNTANGCVGVRGNRVDATVTLGRPCIADVSNDRLNQPSTRAIGGDCLAIVGLIRTSADGEADAK